MKDTIRKELWEENLRDTTEYCCYCGQVKQSFSCCGENHFETFSNMSRDQQEDIIESILFDIMDSIGEPTK